MWLWPRHHHYNVLVQSLTIASWFHLNVISSYSHNEEPINTDHAKMWTSWVTEAICLNSAMVICIHKVTRREDLQAIRPVIFGLTGPSHVCCFLVWSMTFGRNSPYDARNVFCGMGWRIRGAPVKVHRLRRTLFRLPIQFSQLHQLRAP
jgi:hypothetical protein